MNKEQLRTKSFWERPEGVTGLIFLVALILGGGYLAWLLLPALNVILQNTLSLTFLLLAIGALAFMVLDPRMRNLIWFMYKSTMRKITSFFVQLDPIGILKKHVEELSKNLHNMNRQIGQLRGQMHKLKEIIHNNKKSIQDNLQMAHEARENNKEAVVILKSRQAGRLKESNLRLEDLYRKMEILYRVLTKMHENSYILMEDIKDQVAVKEQEQKAIHASHNAMRSAMSLLSGDPDKRAMFDMAMEAVADDVSKKVGEMERFMKLSSNFMDSVDLQQGIFEEEGLKMLEQWEKEGVSLILGEEKAAILTEANDTANVLDLNTKVVEPAKRAAHKNQYDSFFE
jgi:hypothetical protein